MKWSEMSPEQRDALIAEHVFGHRIHTEFAQGSETALDYGVYVEDTNSLTGVTCIEAIPPYTTSMDAAWLIVEKMKEKEATWSAFCYELDGVLTQHKRGWDEYTGNRYITWFEHFMKALNAEGVCLATLRTMGIEVEI